MRGARACPRLTIVTLAGGLANTVFAPLTAVLATSFGWRTSIAVLAGVLAVVVVPLHWIGLRGEWPDVVEDAHPIHVSRTDPKAPIARSRADVRSGLYGLVVARAGVSVRTVVLIGAGAETTALLAVVPGPMPLIFATAMVAGMVRGNLTLLQATAITDRWGTRQYGRLSAILSAPVTLAGAFAPWAGVSLARWSGGHARPSSSWPGSPPSRRASRSSRRPVGGA